MRKEDPTMMRRELSDHLDSRASNPIHVNNLRSLFGIERSGNPGEQTSRRDEQELEIIHSVKSGSLPQASGDDEDQIQQRQLADDAQIRRQGDFDDQNGQNATQKSAFSNNLFHLQKKNASSLNLLPSVGGESNAARQDHNESFNTAKEEVEDASLVYKKDASMNGELDQMTFSKKQKARNPRETDLLPIGRAHSEAEPEENTPSHARRRLQDMIDEDLLQESNGAKSGSNEDLNPFIQQRSQSMFVPSESNLDDLIDYNSAHLQSKEAAKRKESTSRQRKSQFGEAKHLASKVQSRINDEKRKNVFPETTKE